MSADSPHSTFPSDNRDDGLKKHRGKSSKAELLGNHQRSWIWGKHLVQETLLADRWPILELYQADDLPPLEKSVAIPSRLSSVRVPRKRLTQLCGSPDHQGWVARMGAYPYQLIEELIAAQTDPQFWLLIDGIQDPYNLGTILRSAEVFAATGVCLGSSGQTGINSLTARSSVGAVNRLSIARVDNLVLLIERLRQSGITVIGTSLETSNSLDNIDCLQGVALVIGNESRGLTPQVSSACTLLAKIPQPGKSNSLNAAAATAIACYEVQRQRWQHSQR